MKISDRIGFESIQWDLLEPVINKGLSGYSLTRTLQIGNIRLRLVGFSYNYISFYWCKKGHIIYCINGEMLIEMKSGKKLLVSEGMSCHVGDNSDEHRMSSKSGVTVFIVD